MKDRNPFAFDCRLFVDKCRRHEIYLSPDLNPGKKMMTQAMKSPGDGICLMKYRTIPRGFGFGVSHG